MRQLYCLSKADNRTCSLFHQVKRYNNDRDADANKRHQERVVCNQFKFPAF